MSKIEDDVVKKIQERASIGKSKYGVTMERTDLTNLEWLKHAQEEAMDLAVYIEKLIQSVEHINSEDSVEWDQFLSSLSSRSKSK